jgi:hypothetical protein
MSTVNETLCGLCRAIFEGHPLITVPSSFGKNKVKFPNRHHPNREQFVKAAEEGCPFYTQILDTARKHYEIYDSKLLGDELLIGQVWYAIIGDSKRASLHFRIEDLRDPMGVDDGYGLPVAFDLVPTPSQCIVYRARALLCSSMISNLLAVCDDRVRCNPIEGDTSYAPTLQLAKQWIAQCSETHKSCRRDTEIERLPTRLIDVGSFRHSATSIVRLRVSSELPLT